MIGTEGNGRHCATLVTPQVMPGRIALLALLLVLPRGAVAHDIPNDVTIQLFLKPGGQRLQLLVRVPLKAIRDINFPERAGYLDLAQADPLLPDPPLLSIPDFLNLSQSK